MRKFTRAEDPRLSAQSAGRLKRKPRHRIGRRGRFVLCWKDGAWGRPSSFLLFAALAEGLLFAGASIARGLVLSASQGEAFVLSAALPTPFVGKILFRPGLRGLCFSFSLFHFASSKLLSSEPLCW
jgi:hypothetical protein